MTTFQTGGLEPITRAIRTCIASLCLVALSSCFDRVAPFDQQDDTDADADEGAEDIDAEDGQTSDSGGADASSDGEESASTDDDVGTDETGTGEETGSGSGNDEMDTGDNGTDTEDTGSETDDGSTEDDTGNGGTEDDTADGGTADDTGDGHSEETGDTGSETGDTGTDPPGACPTQSHVCVAVPAGWEGPAAVGERTGSQSLPACSGSYAQNYDQVLLGDLSAPAASCSCSCGDDPTPPVCGVTFEELANCQASVVQNTWTFNEGCTSVSALISAGHSYRTSVGITQAGRCERISDSTVEPPAWQSRAALCQFTGEPLDAECASNELCVPNPSTAFAERTCIYRTGDHACPAPFSSTRDWFLDEEVVDSRTCSACTCTLSDASCGGTLSLRLNDNCSASFEDYPWELEACVSWEGRELYTVLYEDTVTSVGSCTEEGGNPVGTATPQSPMTVCCL